MGWYLLVAVGELVGNTSVRRRVPSQPCRGCPCRWDFRPHPRTLHPQKAVGIVKSLKGTISTLNGNSREVRGTTAPSSVARASPSSGPRHGPRLFISAVPQGQNETNTAGGGEARVTSLAREFGSSPGDGEGLESTLKHSCRADVDPSLRLELSGRERERFPGGPACPRHHPAHQSGGCGYSAASDLQNGNAIQSNLCSKHGNVFRNISYDNFFFIFIFILRSSRSETVLLAVAPGALEFNSLGIY